MSYGRPYLLRLRRYYFGYQDFFGHYNDVPGLQGR